MLALYANLYRVLARCEPAALIKMRLPPDQNTTSSLAEVPRFEKGKITIAAINVQIVRKRTIDCRIYQISPHRNQRNQKAEIRHWRQKTGSLVFWLSTFALM
jgi:hypothetical protein